MEIFETKTVILTVDETRDIIKDYIKKNLFIDIEYVNFSIETVYAFSDSEGSEEVTRIICKTK
jgi:hypothetical protein